VQELAVVPPLPSEILVVHPVSVNRDPTAAQVTAKEDTAATVRPGDIIQSVLLKKDRVVSSNSEMHKESGAKDDDGGNAVVNAVGWLLGKMKRD
jgi:hypothetical protein